jgi:peptidyl-prolyl cis-trans isomerase D
MIRFLQTPGPLKKIILGGVLLIICAAMVITLVPGGLGSSLGLSGPGRGVVATVEGNEVTALEVQREARQMVQQQFPQGGAQASMLMPYFASRAAENLIDQKVLLAEAHRIGLRVSDEELSDELQHGRYAAVFFPGGNFIGEEAYQARLQGADLTVPIFERSVKDEILFDKLRDLVTGAATVSASEIHQGFLKQNTRIKFEYAVLQKDDVIKGIHPTDDELKAYYERNKALYNNSTPEKRKIQYVVIDDSKIAPQVQVSQQDLENYYDQHRDEYRSPDQVNVRQILVKTPLPGPDGKVDPKAVEAARKKADDVYSQLKAGANFEDLAKKYSDDPTGKNGGLVGWVQQFPVPEVNKIAFSLPKGGTSGVIDAGYAFVILRVDDKQQAHVKNLTEVKSEIEPPIRQQKVAQAAEAQANALLSQARTSGLDKAAAAKGLQVVTTDYVSRTDSLPGIGNSQQFMEAVFSQPAKSALDEAQLPQGFAVFLVSDIKPPSTPTFDEIRGRVESEFKNEKSAALLAQKTQELSDRAKASHDLKKAAKEVGATLKTSDFVLPDAQVPDIGSLTGPASVVFTMKPGDISGPINTGTGGAVLSVVDKQEPSEQDFAEKRDQIRDSLLQAKQGELFGLFVTNLREQLQKSGKVQINQDEMKTLTQPRGEAGS